MASEETKPYEAPKHLITVAKSLAGGTEEVRIQSNANDVSEIEGIVEASYKAIDARAEVVKAEMKKIEDEVRARIASDKENK